MTYDSVIGFQTIRLCYVSCVGMREGPMSWKRTLLADDYCAWTIDVAQRC